MREYVILFCERKNMALSVDLRERVIAAVGQNIRISTVAQIFKVSKRVIYNWLNLYRKNKSLEPKKGYQKGHSHKIKDLDKFKRFVEKHKKYTAVQMIVVWKKLTGVGLSKPAMGRYLKKIGYSSKKKHLATSKPMLKNANNFYKKSQILIHQ